MNPFPFSDDNKRYHTLYYHNLHAFGGRIYKATLDAGLSCPNARSGGCIFCSKAKPSGLSIAEQFRAEKERILRKDPNARISAYYGIGTNTFCTAERLAGMINEAEALGAFSVSIATRADCLDGEKARIIAASPLPVTVELGLQTIHGKTAEFCNRGHGFEEFSRGFELLRAHGIRVCVHIINGLPGENEEMMEETAKVLAKMRPDGIKIHSCHVLAGTRLCELYEAGDYQPISFEEYIRVTVRQLELLPPETVIERLTGDGDKALLKAPLWSADKISVLGGIDKRMAELDTFQGKYYNV